MRYLLKKIIVIPWRVFLHSGSRVHESYNKARLMPRDDRCGDICKNREHGIYVRVMLLVLLLASPAATAQDYSVGNSPAGAILSNTTIDKACTVRCLKSGGNQSFCNQVCDEAVGKHLPDEVKEELKSITGNKGSFSNIDFECFKLCRESGDTFLECKGICNE